MTTEPSPFDPLDPEDFQRQALARAFRPNDVMENVDRLWRTDRSGYEALPSELRLQHALYRQFKDAHESEARRPGGAAK